MLFMDGPKYLGVLINLGTSKSQKQFLDWLILPKNEGKTWKIYPKISQDEYLLVFCSVFGKNWEFRTIFSLVLFIFRKSLELKRKLSLHASCSTNFLWQFGIIQCNMNATSKWISTNCSPVCSNMVTYTYCCIWFFWKKIGGYTYVFQKIWNGKNGTKVEGGGKINFSLESNEIQKL